MCFMEKPKVLVQGMTDCLSTTMWLFNYFSSSSCTKPMRHLYSFHSSINENLHVHYLIFLFVVIRVVDALHEDFAVINAVGHSLFQ